jgi:oligopeptide transport system permease protein
MNSKMLKYTAKRLLLSVFALLLIITITFFIMHAVPSSPFVKPKALTPAVIEALNKKFGLDKPLFDQYLVYLGNTAKLDFGESLYFPGRTAMSLILDGFKTSIQLGLMAAGIALVLGVVFGSLSAIKRDSKFDKLILVISTASISLPSFVIGVLLLFIFGVWWPILPTRGDAAGGFILPVVSLMMYPAAYITRLMRSSMLDVLSQDYIRTANAKGVSRTKVIFKHAMKNSLTPVVTYFGPMLAYIITGSIVVEKIFSVAGLGKYFVNSITSNDYTMIMGTTIFLSVLMIALNFICDIIYKILDKRIDLS